MNITIDANTVKKIGATDLQPDDELKVVSNDANGLVLESESEGEEATEEETPAPPPAKGKGNLPAAADALDEE